MKTELKYYIIEHYEEHYTRAYYLNTFANDKFKVLEQMSLLQTYSDNQLPGVYLSQQEIADKCNMSKLKINKLIKELEAEGFLECKQRCYIITERAAKAIKLMNKPNV